MNISRVGAPILQDSCALSEDFLRLLSHLYLVGNNYTLSLAFIRSIS